MKIAILTSALLLFMVGCEQKRESPAVTVTCISDVGEWPGKVLPSEDTRPNYFCDPSAYWLHGYVKPTFLFGRVENGSLGDGFVYFFQTVETREISFP